MIILMDTSTPVFRLCLVEDNKMTDYEWQSGRDLAKNIFTYINEALQKQNYNWSDIDGLGIFKGPGSFTGLRIGIAVANTISDTQSIPIVGSIGENWKNECIEKIIKGDNEKIILPFYGAEANITISKK